MHKKWYYYYYYLPVVLLVPHVPPLPPWSHGKLVGIQYVMRGLLWMLWSAHAS